MIEQWHPMGILGVITAFNFPCAVFGWNYSISSVCGNLTLWKPALTAHLITIAVTNIIGNIL